MKIGLRYGHSVNCRGARGILDEVDSCKDLYYLVRDLLIKQGHTVIDCNSNASTESGELNEGTNKADNNNVDIYITLHMNAYNGVARGVECWTYNTCNSMAIRIGSKICSNISALGTPNRGMKYDTGKHDLNACAMESIIVESLFCDNQDDANLFRSKREQIARSIANGIDNNIPLSVEPPKPRIEMHRNIIVYPDGAAADRSSAEFFTMVLNNVGEDCIPIDYTSYKSGKYSSWSLFAVGGSLKDKFKYDKIFAGKDRYETAQSMLEHLKRY
ncbi:N-acetylmuramoyl-L-alanine amidase [Clostridium sp.]|uniref:N-acetylmuramoyl-L-alanine amidase n=1 Tax=Clostridium sp. TaxID=1506 RepID=UPI0032179FED